MTKDMKKIIEKSPNFFLSLQKYPTILKGKIKTL